MCFWIRISSPFHLNILNIPIQKIKCPKTPKRHGRTSFSPQQLFVKLELCCLCTSMPSPICVTGNAIHESHCLVQCFVLGYVFKDDCYFFFKAWNLLPCVSPIISPLFQSSKPGTEGFLVFLGHLMGMFKVFRWNRLEILIPKHMWKSIIGPLEQI